MRSSYHPGELEAQRRAGVVEMAAKVDRIISSDIPRPASDFLSHLSFLIASSVTAEGIVHASFLGGDPGFARVVDSDVELQPLWGHRAEVQSDVEATRRIGLLGIDFSTRRRMRLNGEAVNRGDAVIIVPRQVYSNCPRYIRQRSEPVPSPGTEETETSFLSASQREMISEAETFFIATNHPFGGADASHRGGRRGFVQAGSHSLRWPDYPGNNMFNTIGNLLVEPRCALLFVDFVTGRMLRIEGTASVGWESERVLEVSVKRVLESKGHSGSFLPEP